jgi:hypothetical protein
MGSLSFLFLPAAFVAFLGLVGAELADSSLCFFFYLATSLLI